MKWLTRRGLAAETVERMNRYSDAIEAVFRELNAVDDAKTARRDLCG
jgi:hypothetical protein